MHEYFRLEAYCDARRPMNYRSFSLSCEERWRPLVLVLRTWTSLSVITNRGCWNHLRCRPELPPPAAFAISKPRPPCPTRQQKPRPTTAKLPCHEKSHSI